MVTEASPVSPSLTRSSALLTESPAMKVPPWNGAVATEAPSISEIDRTPEVTPVATGVVLSVKVLYVPRPATAAATPRIAAEPTILRARVEQSEPLARVLTSCLLRSCRTAIPNRQLRRWSADRRLPARQPQDLRKPPTRRLPRPGGLGEQALRCAAAPGLGGRLLQGRAVQPVEPAQHRWVAVEVRRREVGAELGEVARAQRPLPDEELV